MIKNYMKYLLSIIALLIISGCISQPQQDLIVGKRVNFTTQDGYIIFGTYYKNDGKPVIILLHMLSRNRNDWNEFGYILKNHFAVLSIDLRGHGESIKKDGTYVTWKQFSSNDFNNMIFDVAAAKNFLKFEGVNISKIGIIGASIGANTALNYAIGDSDVKALVLLSPSFNYRGINTRQSITQYKNSLLIISSQEDTQSSKDCQDMISLSPSQDKKLEMYKNIGHGTYMLFKENVNDLILTWLKTRLG